MDLNKAIVKMYKQKGELHEQRRESGIGRLFSSMIIQPQTTFEDLHGIEATKSMMLKIIHHFQSVIDDKVEKSSWPILIIGSRGLGKSSLVEAAANYAKLYLVQIQLKQMVSLTRSEFEGLLEHLIAHSRNRQPCVVLLDDLDKVLDKEQHQVAINRAISTLCQSKEKLLVFCTSSSLHGVHDIDFSYTIRLKRPSHEARFQILTIIRERNKNLANLDDDILREVAKNTPSFSPLDLRKMLAMAEIESEGLPTFKKHCDQAIDEVKQSFEKGTHLIGEKPQITWDDIGGMSHVRREFSNILREIQNSAEGKINSCKFSCIALYGEPGCGKTMVAQAMANEAGFNFISIKPAELIDKFLGETEKNIRRVFQEAREHEPCFIYFDEFDGLCGTRGQKDTLTSAIHTLLSEIDGFQKRGQCIVLVSTNRLEDIDPAMLRSGRLSKHIYVGPPDEKARLEILKIMASRPWIKLADDINLDQWAQKTKGFTGADIDHLFDQARSSAICGNDCVTDVTLIMRDHLESAIKNISKRHGNGMKESLKRPKTY